MGKYLKLCYFVFKFRFAICNLCFLIYSLYLKVNNLKNIIEAKGIAKKHKYVSRFYAKSYKSAIQKHLLVESKETSKQLSTLECQNIQARYWMERRGGGVGCKLWWWL